MRVDCIFDASVKQQHPRVSVSALEGRSTKITLMCFQAVEAASPPSCRRWECQAAQRALSLWQ